MELERIKRIGIAAAYKGAEVLRAHFGKIAKVGKKGTIRVSASPKVSESLLRTGFPYNVCRTI